MTDTTEAAIALVHKFCVEPHPDSWSLQISFGTMRAILAHIDAQAAEIEELKHDLGKYMAIANEQVTEIERLRVDAERYAYAKTLEGQVLVIDVFRQDGADALDSEIDKERGK